MRRLAIACLWWISLCGLWRCAPALPKATGESRRVASLPATAWASAEQALLYKAHFQYGKLPKIGGLLVIKSTGEERFRLIFMAELGATLFDFELAKNDFIVHRAFEALNRPMLFKMIENDFRLLLQHYDFRRDFRLRALLDSEQYRTMHRGKRYTFLYSAQQAQLLQQNRSLRILLDEYDAQQIPHTIDFQHYFLPLKMELRYVDRKKAGTAD